MKKIVSLFVLAVAFASCSEDIQFNSPAVQATKNGALWKANDMHASDEGGLTIVSAVGTDIVTLHTGSTAPGTYTLGVNDVNTATYESLDGEGDIYQTGAGIGEGKIVISVVGNIVTGNFDFIAENEEGVKVNFTKGVFYQVPLD